VISARTLRRHFPELAAGEAEHIAAQSRKSVDSALQSFEKLLDGSGIESIEVDDWLGTYWQNIRAVYVNRDDIYRKTLLFDSGSSRFRCTSPGDFVELLERQGTRVR